MFLLAALGSALSLPDFVSALSNTFDSVVHVRLPIEVYYAFQVNMAEGE